MRKHRYPFRTCPRARCRWARMRGRVAPTTGHLLEYDWTPGRRELLDAAIARSQARRRQTIDDLTAEAHARRN